MGKDLPHGFMNHGVNRGVVELHNRGAFPGGPVRVGTLAFMAWLNEPGAVAIAARTQDIELGRRQALELATSLAFPDTPKATGLPFAAIPGLPAREPPTSVKLPGAQGLRVDLLAPGARLGATVRIPELAWSAQAIPYYDYLLADAEPAAALAGGHCVPVRLPDVARFFWHKLYASIRRSGFPEKAAKDRQQALVLGAVLADGDGHRLKPAFSDAPAAMRKTIRPLRKELIARGAGHGAFVDLMHECLG